MRKKKWNQFFNMEVFKNFDTENYTSRLDVQNFSCLILGHFVPKYTLENI